MAGRFPLPAQANGADSAPQPDTPAPPAAPLLPAASLLPAAAPSAPEAEAGSVPAVCMEHLDMRFGAAYALHDVCALVPQGGITGLVGPDAAGKTTLVRLLAGLMAPTAGRLEIFGRPPLEVAAAAPNSLGYMPQRFGLYEDISVLDNLRLHARLRGVEGAARDSLFAELLRFTTLEPFTARLAGKLSGGMKQKLGIACALLGSPRLLLLDEPGVGVDPLSRRDLWRMVQDLADKGMTIIWSTAYLDEAERCPRVIMLDEGRLLYAGPPEKLTARAAGKVFLITPPAGQKRRALSRWTSTAGVADALIQGSRVRVVLKGMPHGGECSPKNDTAATEAESSAAPPALQENESAVCAALHREAAKAAPPRLEDAYMLALGGCNQTPSVFAEGLDEPYAADTAHERPAAEKNSVDARGTAPNTSAQTAECGTPQPASGKSCTEANPLPKSAVHTPAPHGTALNTSAPSAEQQPSAQAPARPRIEARGLTKCFGAFAAAQDITFSVPAGRIFGLLGPNGAGKSTTFRMLCGLSRPTAGECFVDGVNLLTAGGAARGKLGYMAQKFSLYTDLRVRENIRIFGRLYGLTGADLQHRAQDLCAALELTPWLNARTGLLPLGQKQRLALLCATLHRPSVLFLDEPTSGVDARTRRDFWKHITAMTRAGTSVLVTTHFMEEAEYCDTVALVYGGKIISMGTPDALKAASATPQQPDPTMEDAFIDCILRHDKERTA